MGLLLECEDAVLHSHAAQYASLDACMGEHSCAAWHGIGFPQPHTAGATISQLDHVMQAARGLAGMSVQYSTVQPAHLPHAPSHLHILVLPANVQTE